MGLFDVARKVALGRVAGRKSSDVEWDGDRGWTIVRGKDTDETPRNFSSYVLEGWRRNPVVRRCVGESQTSFSEAPLRAFAQDPETGQFERLVDHPAELLMAAPNMKDSGVAYMERLLQHFLLGGNSYIRKHRDGFGSPVRLTTIRPDRVTAATTDEDGIPIAWEVVTDPERGETSMVSARDIVHVPDTDPLNEVFGMPRLASAALETDTDNEASLYVNEVLTNHGTPGTVVSVDGDKVRNAAMMDRAEAQWNERFGPGRGRGKVAFLPGAQSVQQVGFNLHELEFRDLRNITRESICAVFGVDPMLVGFGSAAKGGTLSGSEFQEARRAFWMQTIIPLMRRFEAVLNAFLAPEFGENVFLLFDRADVAALQEDRDGQVERGLKMAQTGAYSREEIRAESGHDPDPEGEVMVVRGAVTFRPVDVLEEEEDGPDGDDAPEDDEDDDELAALLDLQRRAIDRWRAGAAHVKTAKSPRERFSLLGHVADTKEAGVTAWKQFDEFARSQEPVYRLAAEEMFRRERAELDVLARRVLREDGKAASGPTGTKGITPESLDEFERRLGEKFDAYHRDWRRRYDDLMGQTSEVVAGELSGATGFAFSVTNPLVQDAIAERVNMVVGADRKTFSAIQGAVREGFEEGLGRDAIASRIRSVFDEGVSMTLPSGKVRFASAAERARMIATTETTAVANAAGNALMRTTDVDWLKLWLSQGDDRVRPEHVEEEADSEQNPVPLDEPFRVTGLDAPAEVNCRCTVLYEQPDE